MSFNCPDCKKGFGKNQEKLLEHFKKNESHERFGRILILQRTCQWHILSPVVKESILKSFNRSQKIRLMSGLQ